MSEQFTVTLSAPTEADLRALVLALARGFEAPATTKRTRLEWSAGEDIELMARIGRGERPGQIAREMRRSTRAVTSRVARIAELKSNMADLVAATS